MTAENNLENEIFRRWDIFISTLNGFFLFKHNRKALIFAANDLASSIEAHAIEVGGDISTYFIGEVLKKCQTNSPKTLQPRELNRLQKITNGITAYTQLPHLNRQNNLVIQKYSAISAIFGQACSIFSETECQTDFEMNKIPKELTDLCCQATKDDPLDLTKFSSEEKFINLCLSLMKEICEYVIAHPTQTLKHNRHSDAAKLLDYTNDLMTNHREIPPIRRAIMLLDYLHAMDQYGRGNIKQIINNLQRDFFGKDNINMANGELYHIFKLNPSYVTSQDEYKKDDSISDESITKLRNNIPIDVVKEHLNGLPDTTGFFRKLIDWFKSTVNRLAFKEKLNQHGFFAQPQNTETDAFTKGHYQLPEDGMI